MLTSEQRDLIGAKMLTGKFGIVSRAGFEVRDIDTKGRRLLGRAVPYDVEIDLGWYYETIAPGTFTKSIRETAKDLPLLLFHDSESLDSIVGHVERWEDSKKGLDGIWLFDDDASSQRAADKAESGSLGFMSVGFQPLNGERGSVRTWDEDDVMHVVRREARLLETSLTPTPAYKDAVIKKVRAMPTVGTPRIDRWRQFLASQGR